MGIGSAGKKYSVRIKLARIAFQVSLSGENETCVCLRVFQVESLQLEMRFFTHDLQDIF